MGVEYRHFFVPAAPDFIPDNNVIKRIDNLLDKWQLKDDAPKIISLNNGNARINEPLDSIEFGHGVAIVYPHVEGEQVGTIFGPSYYQGIADEYRYIQNTTLIVGIDFRVHPSNQELYLEVIRPALENGNTVEPYDEGRHGPYDVLFGESYRCTAATIAPQIKAHATHKKRIIGNQPFLGYWRTALVMDCGKDLPKLGDDLFTIENTQFLDELEQAMGCNLIQLGEVY